MILTSALFLTFLTILVVLYYIVPKGIQWILLLAASAVFIAYGTQNPLVYLLLAYGILVTFIGAIAVENSLDERKRNIRKIITISLVLVELIVLKYLNFFWITFTGFKGITEKNAMISAISMLAPLGLSFYSLISIGYVLDVSRRVCRAQRNIFKYALFLMYFPQITSGPITRYSEMKEELYKKHSFNIQNIYFGAQRIVWGLFKKLVISERMAVIVNTIFDNYTSYSGLYIVIGAVCFAFQLYADFSGCMDIVLGSSELFGIKLPENFDTPFFSTSISEYWRRWHISLGNWFKDYFFYPLLKSDFIQNMRKKLKPKVGKKWSKKIPTYVGMLILWTTIGLWHGGNYTYLIGSRTIALVLYCVWRSLRTSISKDCKFV